MGQVAPFRHFGLDRNQMEFFRMLARWSMVLCALSSRWMAHRRHFGDDLQEILSLRAHWIRWQNSRAFNACQIAFRSQGHWLGCSISTHWPLTISLWLLLLHVPNCGTNSTTAYINCHKGIVWLLPGISIAPWQLSHHGRALHLSNGKVDDITADWDNMGIVMFLPSSNVTDDLPFLNMVIFHCDLRTVKWPEGTSWVCVLYEEVS